MAREWLYGSDFVVKECVLAIISVLMKTEMHQDRAQKNKIMAQTGARELQYLIEIASASNPWQYGINEGGGGGMPPFSFSH